MRLTDTRRLTGPSLLLDGPGAIVEVEVDAAHARPLAKAWRTHLVSLCRAIGWKAPSEIAVRLYDGGASLAFEAPIDMLYAATEINENAVAAAITSLGGDAEAALDGVGERQSVDDLISSRLGELNTPLLLMEQAAGARGHVFLWDDDEASVGLGTGSYTWPVSALPAPEAVDWDAVHSIPTCIITGTNGKSTTSRMMSAIVQASGAVPGATSTDGVMVGDEWVERGDYSGPGGARTALRDPRVEVGVLEVARGGILRRGLGLPRADAVAVTNVDEDHLGDYGIDTVPQLAEVKFVVAKALASGGALVTNWDDAHCRREGTRLAEPLAQRGAHLVWTGLSPEALPDGPAVSVADGWIVRRSGTPEASGDWVRVVEVAAVPAAMGGAARYNVRNALTACGLAHALGIADDAIARGLASFRSDTETNPGRGNVFTVGGATVWVDFAHNAHGLAALVETVQALPSTRRLVLMSHAGDRTDREIRAIPEALRALDADRYIVADMPDYLRGRAPGAIPALQRSALLGAGVAPEAIETAPDPASDRKSVV